MKTRSFSAPRMRRGVTLLMTMLVLVLATTLVMRQAVDVTQQRLSAAALGFGTQAQWLAEGIARQWAACKSDDLLKPSAWELETGGPAPLKVQIWPASAQDKLLVQAAEVSDVLAFWRRQGGTATLAPDLDQRLLATGNTALETILAPETLTSREAYLAPAPSAEAGPSALGVAPADFLTVWGDGRIDLNHCPLEVMRVRLKGFTDTQLAGILRLRGQGRITTLNLSAELSLSEHQADILSHAGALSPSEIELVIQIRQGGLTALYHAVVRLGTPGRVLEVRPIY